MTLLYPRKNGTGDPVKGKLVPDQLVSKFLKNGFQKLLTSQMKRLQNISFKRN